MLFALLGGLFIGLIMGALGGGGAILAIPLLVYGMGAEPTSATLDSLVIVGLGAATGIITHARTLDWRRGATFGALGVAGAYTGRHLSQGVNSSVLLLSFALLLLLMATLMVSKAQKNTPEETPDGQRQPAHRGSGHIIRLVAAASGVGFLTGFFGVGGGFAIVPALTLILGLGMTVAVGTSLLVILINSLVSLAFSFDNLVTLDWLTLTPLLLSTVVGVFGGSWVGGRVSRRALQLAFAALLYLIALYIGGTSLLGILT